MPMTSTISLLMDASASGLLGYCFGPCLCLATCNLQLAFSCISVDGNTGNVGKESNLWIFKTYSVVNTVHDHWLATLIGGPGETGVLTIYPFPSCILLL